MKVGMEAHCADCKAAALGWDVCRSVPVCVTHASYLTARQRALFLDMLRHIARGNALIALSEALCAQLWRTPDRSGCPARVGDDESRQRALVGEPRATRSDLAAYHPALGRHLPTPPDSERVGKAVTARIESQGHGLQI